MHTRPVLAYGPTHTLTWIPPPAARVDSDRIRWVSTRHRVAAYARSVPDIRTDREVVFSLHIAAYAGSVPDIADHRTLGQYQDSCTGRRECTRL
eukprot:1145429-Rhodomonas_salina.1